MTSRALRAWSDRWAQEAVVDVAVPDLDVDTGVATGDGRGERFVERVVAGGAGPAATLWWPAALETGLARALFGASSPPRATAVDDSLAARSVRHLASELRRLLAQAWRVDGWLSDGASRDEAAPTRWHALLEVRVTVAGAALVARVPALRLRPVAAPGPATALTRAQTVAAFAALQARATAVIGHADISVAELANVRCGDVLLLDASLSDPLQIEIDGAPSSLRAGLGLVGAQRAVQFISISRP
jgi:flagellar motor switch/type III secretory pathway protein FliN